MAPTRRPHANPRIIFPERQSLDSAGVAHGPEVGDVGLDRFSHDSIEHEMLAKSPEQVGANTVANPTLSETVALLIERWENMCPEERAVLTALLCPNSFNVRHDP